MTLIDRAIVEPDKIADFLDRLAPVVEGQDAKVVLVGLLAAIIADQSKGLLTLEEVQEGVLGASSWIASFVASKVDTSRPN